eukprot:gene55786-76463_t
MRGLDLDKLVRIDKKEVFVYGDDCDDSSRGLHVPPPLGTALNKRAVITLWEVFPKSSRGGDDSDDGKPHQLLDSDGRMGFRSKALLNSKTIRNYEKI